MSKRNYVVVAVAAAALLVAGGLFASNMGFKLNYVMDGPADNGSASGTQALALPFNQRSLGRYRGCRSEQRRVDLEVPAAD